MMDQTKLIKTDKKWLTFIFFRKRNMRKNMTSLFQDVMAVSDT